MVAKFVTVLYIYLRQTLLSSDICSVLMIVAKFECKKTQKFE